MSEIIKNKSVFLILALAVVLALLTSIAQNRALVNANTQIYQLKTVLIDAGHGAPDNGATGVSGTKEKDLNLQVAMKLKDVFLSAGYKVVMTREGDGGIYDEGVKNLKRSDLNNRVKMMKESGADLFISIHMNKFEESKYYGAQVFYSKNDHKSVQVAQSVQTELKNSVDPTNNRECKETYDSIFVLKNATVPAILVECGFLSNAAEEEKLKQDTYQQQLAQAIFDGVIKSYGVSETNQPESAPKQ